MTAASSEALCARCGTVQAAKTLTSGNPALPRGWHRHREETWCATCWKSNFMLRAVTVPLAGAVEGTQDERREWWLRLWKLLHARWRDTTRTSNWAIGRLVAAEPARLADQARMPKLPRVYLYPEARALSPELAPQSVCALLQAVERRYRARRFWSYWRCEERPPTFRYPAPLPIHNQSWSVEILEDGRAVVTARLGPGPEGKWRFRLRGGAGFRRQLRAARLIASGEAARGELALYAVPAQAADHRPAVDLSRPGGGRSRTGRIMVKLCAWLPKRPGPRELSGTLWISTAGEALLAYRVEDGETHWLRCDHVRRWAAEHRRMLSRTSDDLKRENRWPAEVRRRALEARQLRVQKHGYRMDSHTHEVSAMLAGFARRRRVARVIYQDTDRSYVAEYPWHQLWEQLAYKLKETGIDIASGSVPAENQDALAETDPQEEKPNGV